MFGQCQIYSILPIKTHPPPTEDIDQEGSRRTKQTTRFRFRSIMRKVLLLVKWEIRTEEYRRNLNKKRGARRISILDDPG